MSFETPPWESVWPESFETLLVGCLARRFSVLRDARRGCLAREFRDAPCGLSGSGTSVFRDPGGDVWHVSFETLPVGCLALLVRVSRRYEEGKGYR